MQPSRTEETYNPDRLIAGDAKRVTRTETVVSGQTLGRGALVGKITTGGKLTLSLSASSDGSQVPYGIMADAVDASAGDVDGPVYLSGEFAAEEVTFGADHTAASVRDGLRDRGIFLKSTVAPVA